MALSLPLREESHLNKFELNQTVQCEPIVEQPVQAMLVASPEQAGPDLTHPEVFAVGTLAEATACLRKPTSFARRKISSSSFLTKRMKLLKTN